VLHHVTTTKAACHHDWNRYLLSDRFRKVHKVSLSCHCASSDGLFIDGFDTIEIEQSRLLIGAAGNFQQVYPSFRKPLRNRERLLKIETSFLKVDAL